MQGMLFPILIAVAVALAGAGIAQVVASLTDPEKRRLKKRLSGEVQASQGTPKRSITREFETSGVSLSLTKWSIIDRIHRKLVQAYPDMTLGRFMAIALALGLAMFVLV